MGIRSVSSWIVSSLALLVVVACGGGDKGASTTNTPPAVTVEGVWIQTQFEDKDPMGTPRVTRVARFSHSFVIKGNAYSFYEDKKEVEKGELTFDGKALISKSAVPGAQSKVDPVILLTANTLTIGIPGNHTTYVRATQAELNEHLGIEEQANNVPVGVPLGPEGEESLEGFWALKDAREGGLVVPAKPGELIFKVVNGQFESYENGKLAEKGTVSFSFDRKKLTSVSGNGTTVATVKSFGQKRGLVIEEETNGKKKGKTFKRVTEAEFNSLMKGEEPPKVEPNKEETPATSPEAEKTDGEASSQETEMEMDTEAETEGEDEGSEP